MFLEWWNTTKSLSNIWLYFSCLMRGLQKCAGNLNPILWLFEGRPRQGKTIAVRWAELVIPPCRTIKKPSWDFIFFQTFCLLSSRLEKLYQILEILFLVFHHSRKIPSFSFGFGTFYSFLAGHQVYSVCCSAQMAQKPVQQKNKS